jgi:hypothetical protein
MGAAHDGHDPAVEHPAWCHLPSCTAPRGSHRSEPVVIPDAARALRLEQPGSSGETVVAADDAGDPASAVCRMSLDRARQVREALGPLVDLADGSVPDWTWRVHLALGLLIGLADGSVPACAPRSRPADPRTDVSEQLGLIDEYANRAGRSRDHAP